MRTPPTEICRSLAMPRFSVTAALRPSPYVVREADHEQDQHERDADHRNALVELAAECAAADPLDDREGDVAAVEREQRQEVEEREREADQAQHEDEVAEALVERLRGDLRDADGARDLAGALAGREPREEQGDLLGHAPRDLRRAAEGRRQREPTATLGG